MLNPAQEFAATSSGNQGVWQATFAQPIAAAEEQTMNGPVYHVTTLFVQIYRPDSKSAPPHQAVTVVVHLGEALIPNRWRGDRKNLGGEPGTR
jgi:hypothetical protein